MPNKYMWLELYKTLKEVGQIVNGMSGIQQDGGEGSGNFEHKGRPGKVGGSGESGFMKHLDRFAKDPATRAKHSIGPHIGEDGKLAPQRKKLHRDITKELLNVDSITDNPAIYFMGGGSASGKSSAVEAGLFGDMPRGDKNDKGQFIGGVYLDPDEVKKMIPEFRQQVKDKNPRAAGYAHEESSALVKYALDRSYKLRVDTVVDGTLGGPVDKVRKKIQQAKATGRPVIGNFVTVDIDEALERNYQRYLNGAKRGEGRMPNPYVAVQIHKEVTTNFEALTDLFDSMVLVDNNGPKGSSKKIAEVKDGKLQILDKKAYKSFRDKQKVDIDEAVANFYKRHPEAPKFDREVY